MNKECMVTVFSERVYELCSRVPQGKVTTYKAIAMALGGRGYQAVGQALRCNPYAPEVPCHRVVASDGGVGGFMGCRRGDEIGKKVRLLCSEGVDVVEGRVDLEKYFVGV